jgi:hypothetical protein
MRYIVEQLSVYPLLKMDSALRSYFKNLTVLDLQVNRYNILKYGKPEPVRMASSVVQLYSVCQLKVAAVRTKLDTTKTCWPHV